MKKSLGFTLIELLIALAIFSMVSVGALASLNHMMRAREQQVEHHETNKALDLAYAHFFQDMQWFVGDVSADSIEFQFLRTQKGLPNSMAKTRYRVEDGKVFRATLTDDSANEVLVLKDVTDLNMSWMLKNMQWVGVFDQPDLSDEPLLLRVQFTAPHLGEVTWIFATPHL